MYKYDVRCTSTMYYVHTGIVRCTISVYIYSTMWAYEISHHGPPRMGQCGSLQIANINRSLNRAIFTNLFSAGLSIVSYIYIILICINREWLLMGDGARSSSGPRAGGSGPYLEKYFFLGARNFFLGCSR